MDGEFILVGAERPHTSGFIALALLASNFNELVTDLEDTLIDTRWIKLLKDDRATKAALADYCQAEAAARVHL